MSKVMLAKKPANEQPTVKIARQKRLVKYKRRAFMIDDETAQELEAIQEAARLPTASATVRYVVRKLAHLMRQCGEEDAIVQIVLPQGAKRSRRSFVEVDIPPLIRT